MPLSSRTVMASSRSSSRTMTRRGRMPSEDAHVVVEREAIYTLAAQKRGGEGDHGRVGGAQELPHDPRTLAAPAAPVEPVDR
jgi:hypothetical protein